MARKSAHNYVSMIHLRTLKFESIFLVLALVLPSLTVDCAGRMKDLQSPDSILVPGGLDTNNKGAKHDFIAAWNAMNMGQTSEAVFFFQLSLNKDPEFPQAYYGLGLAYMKLNKFQEALAFLDLSRQKGKSNETFISEVLKTRQECLAAATEWLESNAKQAMEDNKWEEAIVFLRNTLTFKPESTELQILLADSLFQHNDYMESIEMYNTVLRTNPASIPALKGILKCYIAINDYDAATYLINTDHFKNLRDEELLSLQRQITNRLNILSMPQEYRTVFKKESITRGDLAAILANSPILDRMLQSEKSLEFPYTVLDISTHWAKQSIITLLLSGIMRVYENHTFRPDKTVMKYELAEILLQLTSELPTEAIPENPDVAVLDVSPLNPSYAAVQWVLKKDLMKLSEDQRFQEYNPVSGEEIQTILIRLKVYLSLSEKKIQEKSVHM